MRQTVRATIRDVADRSGVSITTVSHVLNDVPGKRVSPQTRQRVIQAAQDLLYRPNRLAKGLRTQRTQTIGLISDRVLTTPFASRMIAGAHDAAAESGSLLLLLNSGGDPDLEQREVEALLERQVDGIVYASMYHRVIDPPAGLADTHAVLLDARSEAGAYSSVVPDEVGGAREAVEVLLAAGHRHIGFVNNEEAIPAQALRLAGYRQALAGHAIPFDPARVVEGYPSAAGGYGGAIALLTGDDRPSGIFCAIDRMAMGVYQACHELGLTIPGDVSIVGFDDQELIAGDLRPSLTTMALPHYEMGHWAVKALLGQIDAEQPQPPRHTVLACPLIRRESVAAPRSPAQQLARSDTLSDQEEVS